jgi:uncharacterized protein (DUF427 family)
MGLAWQQGPLAPGAIGTFLVPQPLPERVLYAEPLRRRMRVLFGGAWIAQSDDVVLLHEPGRYPVAYFPKDAVAADVLRATERVTEHPELGRTVWYGVSADEREAARAAWEHVKLPDHASILTGRVAFAWHAMDAFYEEAERILGHAADPYHRIDIRDTTRHLVVRAGEAQVADSQRPRVLYESGFAPRWYVPREDVDEQLLTAVPRQTFCPYKGLCSYYDAGGATRGAWSYLEAYREVDRIAGFVSFEPDKVTVTIDGEVLEPQPGQNVVPHGPDRGLTPDEVAGPTPRAAAQSA